ncbi:MAG TPA: DUF4430 domain-containing protein [Candidatus Saccharimonadales bacterium]|nr:DUF4430 domain-containing protein [Candidatus Saccharimonadales bacterium]
MKKILQIFYKTKLLPYLILVVCLAIAGLITYTLAPKPKIAGIATTKTNPISPFTPTPSSTEPTVTIHVRNGFTPRVLPTSWGRKPFPTLTETPTVTVTYINTVPTTQPTLPIITATPIPQTPTPSLTLTISPTPTQTLNTVSLQLKTPDTTSNATITLKDGANVCDVLDEAKNEGKISSVTFDDSYMSSLHSKYVSEINGYKNNWTFTINGSAPLGCSLFHPKPNDSIVWKFG